MTARKDCTSCATHVAVDVAKKSNTVLVETAEGRRCSFRMGNSVEEFDRFVTFLRKQPRSCRVGMEPTGTYHRALAHRLVREGIDVWLISSVAAARLRDAIFNSWDKNDPKDAQVLLELLKQGRVLRYHDPIQAGVHDLQELSKTYMQVTLARTRLQHSLLTHYLPLYWPEFERFWHTTRADWVAQFLDRFPIPAMVRSLDREAFVQAAWALIGRKTSKRAWLEELYDVAEKTIGLPVDPNGLGVRTFRYQLARYRSLNCLRKELEELAETTMGDDSDFALLKTIPGIGTILAMVVLAEAGDLRRFDHHRQFVKFCGLDLAKCQSGAFRGQERLSKRGNARLRCAFWFAGRVAVRMRENSFRAKYERYIRPDPLNRERRRKALTAVAAKMARVAYSVIKTGQPYQAYFEAAVPSGSIPISRAVGASETS